MRSKFCGLNKESAGALSVIPAIPAKTGAFTVVEAKKFNKDMPSGALGACGMPRDGKNGVLEVPFDDSPISKATRLHEYAHLAIEGRGLLNKKKVMDISAKLGVRRLWLEITADVVVNSYAYKQGCTEITALPFGLTSAAEVKITPENLEGVALDLLRVMGMKYAGRSGVSLGDCPHGMRKAVFQLLRYGAIVLTGMGCHATMQSAEPFEEELARIALGLQSIFDAHEQDNKKDESPPPPQKTGREQASETNVREMVEQAIQGSTPVVTKPGEMEIMHVPLDVHHRSRLGRKRVPSFAGAFRYPHRAFLPVSDGKAFGTRKRVPGGTLLLDCSGSMDLQDSDIDKFMDKAPHVTVALYAGGHKTDGEYSDGSGGRLIVVASRGKKVKSAVDVKRTLLGGLNIIDVPALEWLNQQQAPRMWVSDGGVTGAGHTFAINITQECVRLVKEGGVEVQESMEEFLKD